MCTTICAQGMQKCMDTHTRLKAAHIFIGLPDFAKSDFLDSKRPELSKMDQNDRFEPRKSEKNQNSTGAYCCVHILNN
jgi:hypothetical protein